MVLSMVARLSKSARMTDWLGMDSHGRVLRLFRFVPASAPVAQDSGMSPARAGALVLATFSRFVKLGATIILSSALG